MRVFWREQGVDEVINLDEFTECRPAAEIMTIDGQVFHGKCRSCGQLIIGQMVHGENLLQEKFCEECFYETAAQ